MKNDSNNKGGKGRQPRRGPRRDNRPQVRIERALREIKAVIRALAENEGLPAGEELPMEQLALTLDVPTAGDIELRNSAKATVEELQYAIREHLKAKLSFRPGRLFCYQCDSCECRHSEPTSSTDTFAGYTATGKPTWKDFANLCLERKDERVDRLFGKNPEVVAVKFSASELTSELLPKFGRGSLVFRVLGQVTVGLIQEKWFAHRKGDARIALTLQFVETRSNSPRHRLRLNILNATLDDLAATGDAGGRAPAERLRRAIGQSKKRLESLARKAIQSEARNRDYDVLGESAVLLTQLSNEVEKVFRPPQRRTQHAQDRHVGGKRPTSSAMRDARETPDERLLYDTKTDTIVVLGPKGRAHLFSPTGKHVTSLQLNPGEVERKSKKRWRPIDKQVAESWRKAMDTQS